jgi:hypothetical protein
MLTLSTFISLISLALAIGIGFVLAYVLRAERRRSDARVAALSQMAMADFLPEPEAEPVIEPAAIPVEASDALFREPASASPWSIRIAIAGTLAFVMIVVLAIGSLRSTTSGAVASQQAEERKPLELVALGHTQNDAGLTVAGRVQNPRGAQAVTNLTATVFLFGQDGAFLTSGRSPLEVGTLNAGVESPFSVSIPVNGVVARYRVSFRDSSGHPVGHVDKRNTAALARND